MEPQSPRSRFAERLDAFFEAFYALDPVRATDVGYHAHDGRWPDLTDAGRAAKLAFVDRWSEELRRFPDPELTTDERVDRDVVLGELEAIRFSETELRSDRWDPVEWVEFVGAGLFLLLAREFAPLPARLASFAARLEGLPAVLDAARDRLTGVDGRPVPRLHVESALDQLPGVGELIDDALAQAAEAGEAPELEALRTRLRLAAGEGKRALDAFERHLREVVLPASEGDGRLGAALYRAKLRHTLRDSEMTPERLLARAERDFAVVRAEMVRLARELWPSWRPGEPMPTAESAGSPERAEGALVRGVLDAIAADHPAPEAILELARSDLERIERFVVERDLIAPPDEPLAIEWTPRFLRAFAGASLWSPGPLDRHLRALYLVTPIPDDWSAEERESFLRENNRRQWLLTTVHEAVPGHYLQGVWANRCPSLARAIFSSGVYAEGWAVYVTQVVVDAGFAADDPALALVHWKFYLRSIANAILDVRIHTAGMSEEEALRLMVDGAFQEVAEARNKYRRARLTSTQLSTYFVGSIGLWDLELARRRRLAAAAGAGREAVPEPRVVGGIGDTPGFAYRAHLEEVLRHGAPPIPLLRRLVLGD